MKIIFENSREYEILSATYELDENNTPIDIVLIGSKDVLDTIAEAEGLLGYNVQPLIYTLDLSYIGDTYEALYGRLRKFDIINAKSVTFK